MITAGMLDRRIVLQDRAAGVDSIGGENGAWSNTATVWARYTPVKGTESFLKVQRYAETEAQFLIRWRAGVTPRTRVSFDGKTWDVLGVLEVGRREGLNVLAKAASNG